MKIVFVGGWATSPEQYPSIAASAQFLVPFTGFDPKELPRMLGGGGDVLVGWSTGAHILLKDCRHLFELFDRVVLIAPFLAFTDSFPERLVRGMIDGMAEDPESVVAAFHKNCGESEPPAYDPGSKKNLISGLEYLLSSKIDTGCKINLPNVIIVHASRDRIVRRKAIERVSDTVENADFIKMQGDHKISEPELMRIIKGL